jgi:hypothetical protein
MDKILTPETFNRWFSASTDADQQLQNTITTNKFEYKKPTYTEISNTLFRCNNMYDNYKPLEENITPMPYPAHITEKTINSIINILGYKPTFGVEVGSFIGSSATILGNLVKESNGTLLCIDTWCGDINMWLMSNFHTTMGKSDGNPKIFDLFVKNMINNNLKNYVIPLRCSSIIGARMLKVLNYEIDFIYIDSAHEAGETFMELMLYHDILKEGGVLFGDDYHGFPAVKYDVDLFCKYYNYNLYFTGDGDTWIIQKK